ncbi:MAG: hypothetical protein ACI35W_06035 [Anaeroplasmataceae bacterium]
MKINERIYDYAQEDKKIESQELDDHNLEIYKLNDYPDLLEEFTNKGKFAVWSSVDGKDYRLFIEEGYLNEVKDLYSKKVNNIWLKFWDKCEKIATKFRNIVLPLTIILMVGMFLITYLLSSPLDTILVISIAVVFFIGVIIYRKISNKQFGDANKESVDEIKKVLGERRFENLLEKQRSYMDSYFKYEEPEDLENNESEEVKPDNKEAVEIIEAETEALDNKEDAEIVEAETLDSDEEDSSKEQ